MIKNCDNCNFSRLKPCPYLMNVTCGHSHHYVKWTKMTDIILDPPAEDDIEKELREKMITRRRMESPMLKLKIVGVVIAFVILFMAFFFFKAVKYVNQIMFTIFGLMFLISSLIFIYKNWKKKRNKKKKDKKKL